MSQEPTKNLPLFWGCFIALVTTSFKLHAPKNTIVEGRVENGELLDLKVTPESRCRDVVVGK